MSALSFIIFGLIHSWAVGHVQKQPSVSSKLCSESNCQLPQCFCPGRRGPSHLQTHDIPQIVMLTFDDAVNSENFEFYRELLNGKRLNPNGCPITATFFVSHDWTDYKLVKRLYLAGHEIADHSVSHRLPRNWWRAATYRNWEQELEGQRRNIAKGAGVPRFEVRGVRVPFLEIGGDVQFEVMADKNFEYDSSFLTGPYNEGDWRLPAWPYTLEFAPELEYCDSNNCPKANFSGIWEVPLNRWLGLDGQACSMVDGCNKQVLRDKEEALRYLWKNFNRHYGKNRAPLGVNMHAVWFEKEFRFEAFKEFVDGILDLHDVYLVSIHQAIEWVRHPTSVSAVAHFEPWLSCDKKRVLVQKRPHGVKIRKNGNSTRSDHSKSKLKSNMSKRPKMVDQDDGRNNTFQRSNTTVPKRRLKTKGFKRAESKKHSTAAPLRPQKPHDQKVVPKEDGQSKFSNTIEKVQTSGTAIRKKSMVKSGQSLRKYIEKKNQSRPVGKPGTPKERNHMASGDGNFPPAVIGVVIGLFIAMTI